MSKKKKKVRKAPQEIPKLRYLMPLIFVLAVVPLITYVKMDALTGANLEYWTGSDVNPDFFSYYKALWLSIATGIGVLLIPLRKRLGDLEIRKSNYYIPMGAYALFIILSTVFAEHKQTALNGFVDRHEGMYVLLAYVLIMFVAMSIINSELNLKIIMGFLVISATVIGAIGTMQFFGYDFYQTEAGKLLILLDKYEMMKESMQFNFPKNRTYVSLYNPNYVGSYVSLLFPISLGLMVYAKKMFSKIAATFLGCLMFLILLGSSSRAGALGVIFGVIVFAILFRKYLIKRIKVLIIGAVAIVLMFTGINIISEGNTFENMKIMNMAGEVEEFFSDAPGKYIKDLRIDGNNMTIVTDSEKFTLMREGEGIKFFGDQREALAFVVKENKITFEDEKYSGYELEIIDNGKVIKLNAVDKGFYFYSTPDGFKIAGRRGTPFAIEYPQKIGFEGKEKFASSRGYIWSRTFPMLKDTLITGYGPDTYTIYFPQEDFIGKLNAFGQTNIIVDKPHNLYLQIAVNTGVLSLIAVLVLFGMYLVSSVKLYFRKNINTFLEIMGACIFVSFAGYCVAGIFNDSVVSVAPVFWVLLGIGISCNYMIRKNDGIKKFKWYEI